MLVVLLLVVAVSANGAIDEKKFQSTKNTEQTTGTCASKTKTNCDGNIKLEKCTAKYGGFTQNLNEKLNKYMCEHIGLSYKYLRLATNFNSHMKDRGGLYKLFRGLSDDAWEDSVELAKYITKRSGSINVPKCKEIWDDKKAHEKPIDKISMTEIVTLSDALEWHKTLAGDAYEIHKHVSNPHENRTHYDPEVSSFIEKHYVHEHAEKIRQLTGYVNDLVSLVNSKDAGLGLYLFDEHLKKLL